MEKEIKKGDWVYYRAGSRIRSLSEERRERIADRNGAIFVHDIRPGELRTDGKVVPTKVVWVSWSGHLQWTDIGNVYK